MKVSWIALLVMITAGGQAAACSYLIQTQLDFAAGSAELQKAQVINLVKWLDRSYETVPRYALASIEVGASGQQSANAKALAEKRAASTSRALSMLMRDEVPIETVARAYRSPKNSFNESNDFASIQLYPDFEKLSLPDCNPVPIPGFRR